MAITGSQKAYTYALSNVARSGATRSGYVSGTRVHQHRRRASRSTGAVTSIALDSLTITDSLDEVPNRCTFRIIDSVPTTGQDVIITLGSTNGARLFAGHVSDGRRSARREADARPRGCLVRRLHLAARLSEGDEAVHRTSRRPPSRNDLIATLCRGEWVHRARRRRRSAGASTKSRTRMKTCTDALTRLARRIGAYWYVDYRKDVHLFFDDARPCAASHRASGIPRSPIDGFQHHGGPQPGLDARLCRRARVEGDGRRSPRAIRSFPLKPSTCSRRSRLMCF